MKKLIDRIRDVPEFAVRIYLGAAATVKGEGVVEVELDGRKYQTDPETMELAEGVAKALLITPKEIEYATDVLDLRHKAEDIFLHQLSLDKELRSCLFVPAGDLGGSYYRSMMPADSMDSAGVATGHYTHRLDLGKAARYDAVWVQLAAVPKIRQILESAQRDGIKILYDLDDRPDNIPDHNPAAKLFQDTQLAEILEMIKMADVVTVSTRTLAEWARKYAKKVVITPNYLPAAIWPPAPRRPREYKRILWAGSPTHKPDLEIVGEPIRMILEEARGSVRFTCFGEELPKVLHGVSEYIDQVGFVAFEKYAETLASVDADIGIAPLAKLEFNQSKSAIKILEYAGCGYVSLASPVGEYSEMIRENGMPAALVDDHEWYTTLRGFLAQSRDELQIMGDEARRWVEKNRCLIMSKAKPWTDALEAAFE